MFLSCPEVDILPIFLSGIFLFCFLVCFSTKICPENSRENRPFSPRICLFKSREISLFFRRIIRSPATLTWTIIIYQLMTASSSGASIFAETKREQSEREARGTTGRRRKASETPARKRVDFLAILSFSWHSHFSAFLSLESRQF